MSNPQWRTVDSINRMFGSGVRMSVIVRMIAEELSYMPDGILFTLHKERTVMLPITNPYLEKDLSGLTATEELALEKALEGLGEAIGCEIELDAMELGSPNELVRCIKISEPTEDTIPDGGGDDDSDMRASIPEVKPSEVISPPLVMKAHA